MHQICDEKWQTTHNGRSRTTKSRKIRTLGEKETYKYLGRLEADNIKRGEMKDKIKKDYLRRTRELLEIKFYSGNLFKGVNINALPPRKTLGTFLLEDQRRN